MRYRLLRSIAILAVLLFALWPVSVLAASDFPVNISGLEVFPGIPNGNIVYGDTFAGWVGGTGANASGWAPCPRAFSCGGWTVVINYSDPNGTGIGKGPATILSGVWFLTLPNGHNFSGTVLVGTVTWPSGLSTDIGCGDGVATASAGLSFSSGGTGSFGGCLDDTHPQQIFPPHIWGTINKS